MIKLNTTETRGSQWKNIELLKNRKLRRAKNPEYLQKQDYSVMMLPRVTSEWNVIDNILIIV